MKIDRAGFPFIAAALVPAVGLAAAKRYKSSAGLALLTGFLTYFFRDPERQVPVEPGLVVSPADGRIMIAGPSDGRWAPPGDWLQVTIFLSPMDVHINRTPVGGRVTRIHYRPGTFLPAYDESANDNELNEIWLDHDGRTVVFRQVVGMLARRIVCRVVGRRRARARRSRRADEVRLAHGRLPADGRPAPGLRSAIASSAARRSSPSWGRPVLGSLPLRRREDRPHRFRRGVYLLPSLFTVANLFCGYACVVYATRADFDTAALFIGVAMVLDTLDGLIARLTNSTSAFGVQLDSLADVVSFGMAPAILAFTWGLWPLKRLGWAAGFIYVTAAAMRLARFNIQTTTAADKRHFVGLPSPAAGAVIASTVYLWPDGPAGVARGAAGAGDGAGAGVPDGQHDPLPQRQGDRRRLAAVRISRCSWPRW